MFKNVSASEKPQAELKNTGSQHVKSGSWSETSRESNTQQIFSTAKPREKHNTDRLYRNMAAVKAESMNVQKTDRGREEQQSWTTLLLVYLPEGSYKMRCLSLSVCVCVCVWEREIEREIAAVSQAQTLLLTVGQSVLFWPCQILFQFPLSSVIL